MGEKGRALALLCAGALCACGRGGGADSAASQVARVGHPAPSWSEPLFSGRNLSSADLRGKAVYLNFFATWCPPCNAEAASVNALQRAYAARGLQVVGVDVLESARKAAQFSAEHHLSYPIVVDGGVLRDQYEINDLPVHVFIDSSGIVRRIVLGELSPAQMNDNAESVLR